MTPEAQHIAIAEVCGHAPELRWQVLSPDSKGSCFGGEKWECEQWLERMQKDCPDSDYSTYHVAAWKFYRDYTEDLNAMHAAVKSQPPSVMKAMRFWLFEMCDEMTAHEATAAQRAEAFLRTVGRWQEDA